MFIGYNAGYDETGSNKLYIENSDSSNPLIYGEFDNDFVKINGGFQVTGDYQSADGSSGATGWFDDGNNFRITIKNGIITDINTTVSGGYYME